jgi:EAL domain-containing protein (putative c-di-GMP-specific phosphodiesterase class I)
MAALQTAERLLARPEDGPDPLTRALNALNTRTLAMALQPIVASGSRKPVFYEALARVPNAQGGLESTQELVTALEAHGSIALLDHRMLSLGIDALEADPALMLAVNVSPRSLADPDWFRYAEVRLSRRADLAGRLLFEITEQVDLGMIAHIRPQIMSMRNWGARLAIDDFGMGRTSLRHLNVLPIETVKIAGNFVQNLMRSIEDRQFVSALIGLARQCGLKTVAEWVEDEPTAVFLEKCGVDFMQGRLFGAAEIAPLPQRSYSKPKRHASAVG